MTNGGALPGQSVCPPGWVNLSRRGTPAYCHPAPDLSPVPATRRSRRDVPGAVWRGGTANAGISESGTTLGDE